MKIKSAKLKVLSFLVDLMQWMCFPIAFLQIYIIRKNVIELPEASGDRAGRVGVGKDLSVLITGDSSACGVGVEYMEDSLSGHLMETLKKRYNCRWKILAESGLTTDGLIKLVDQDPKDYFDFAVIAVGMNDIVAGKNAEKWLQEMILLNKILTEKYKVSTIIISGIPPVRKLKHVPLPLRFVISSKAFVFDSYLKLICKKLEDRYYIGNNFPVNKETMAVDRFHPNSVYYKSWAIKISETLINIFDNN